MKILITNDDGIDGIGLKLLVNALKDRHEIWVVAPKENNSAASHRITMRSAVSFERVSEREYAVGGTPADCVLVSLCYLRLQPDLILSGVNTGVNMGSDVLYSGTVGAAMEGAQNEIPSIALSQYLHRSDTEENIVRSLSRAVSFISENLDLWAEYAEKTGALNINFPPCDPLGVRFCKQAHTRYNTTYREEEGGLRMEFHPPEPAGEGDIPLLKSGYITITPLKVDLTDHQALEGFLK